MVRQSEHKVFRFMLMRRISSFFIFLCGFLIFFSILLTMMSNHNAEVNRSTQQERIERSLADLEDTLTRVSVSQRQIVNSRELSRFLYMYDDLDWYTRYTLQHQLRERLYALRANSDSVRSAYLYIPSLGKTISDSRASTSYSDWVADAMEKDSTGPYLQGDRVLTAEAYLDVSTKTKKLAVLVVELDKSALLNQVSYVCTGDTDSVEILWNSTMASFSPDDSCLEAEGSVFPIRLRYHPGRSSSNIFVTQVFSMCLAFVGLIVLIELITLIQWYRQVYMPLHKLLIEAFTHVEQGDLKFRISINDDSPFHAIFTNYNDMVAKMETYVESNLKQQILVSRANFKLLQSQISPHFMYNSYYILYRLIKKGDRESSMSLAENLGQFYHYVTRNADDEKHLSEEVEHARTYSAIQRLRFRDALDVQIDAPDSQIAQVYVPRLILQPVLENAFKYAYDVNPGETM